MDQAQLAVPEKAKATRERAFRRGLEEVLVKVSGDRTLAAGGGVGGALKRATRYVRQFRYDSVAAGADPAATES